MKNCSKKLLEAKTLSEANKILETTNTGPAAKKLLETAFSLKASQPKFAEQFMNTVIQEIEDDEDLTNKVLPKNASTEPPTDELQDEHGSDTQTGLVKKGTDASNTDIEGLDTASGEDQMKENHMMPPLAPELQNGMMNNAMNGQGMPQGYPTMPQMQQMQYTVKTTTAPLLKEIKKLVNEVHQIKEAQIALDSKITETQQSNPRSMTLQIPNSPQMRVRETSSPIPDQLSPMAMPRKDFPKFRMEERRSSIAQLNRLINAGNQPYQ